MREKLQFIEKENNVLKDTLAGLEKVLSDKRTDLGIVKAERDKLRAKGNRIKQSGVNITSSQLLDDIEVRAVRSERRVLVRVSHLQT